MTKGASDGVLDIGPVSRARQVLRSLACRGNMLAIAVDELITEFNGLIAFTKPYHKATITPGAGSNSPGQQPTLNVLGESLLVAEMVVNTSSVYRIFRIPVSYISNPQFHVHWTKSGDTDESGNEVLWRINYKVFSGNDGEDVSAAPSTIDLPDSYTDSGTTTRLVHRTDDGDATGFVAGYYVGIGVQALTPAGTPLASAPALVSVDLTFLQEINR